MEGAALGIKSVLCLAVPKPLKKPALMPGLAIKRTDCFAQIIICRTMKQIYTLCRLVILPTLSAYVFFAFFLNLERCQRNTISTAMEAKQNRDGFFHIELSHFSSLRPFFPVLSPFPPPGVSPSESLREIHTVKPFARMGRKVEIVSLEITFGARLVSDATGSTCAFVTITMQALRRVRNRSVSDSVVEWNQSKPLRCR